MIDTGHLVALPDNNGKIFDAAPLRTHSQTLTSKALHEVQDQISSGVMRSKTESAVTVSSGT